MTASKRRSRRRSPSSGCAPASAPADAEAAGTIEEQAVPATKSCSICRVAKPTGEFRRRRKHGSVKHSYCNGCRRAYEADRRFAKRHGQLGRFNSMLAKHRLDSRAVVQFCHKAFDYFGGLDRFAQLWNQHLTLALKQSPGRKYVLDAFGALLALVRVVEEYREQHRRSPDDMSDEELEASLRELLVGSTGGESDGEEGVDA
jgi:hypothetical protein